MSNTVGIFLRQVVLHNGLPFEVKLPVSVPLSYSSLTKEEFEREIENGFNDIKEGRVYSADEVESSLKKRTRIMAEQETSWNIRQMEQNILKKEAQKRPRAMQKYSLLMKMKETFYTSDRREWRNWLAENFEIKSEIWFVFPSKDSGELSLSYNDAVEEALCFGWIDSTTGHIDEKHGIRRFTPRKDFGYYSRPNIERLIWLDRQGLIHPKVRPTVAEIIEAEYVFPEDILDAIRANDTAWENYQGFSESYKRIRVAYIDAARKRPEEFEKRLKSFLSKTRENKMIKGFGGIEKYY